MKIDGDFIECCIFFWMVFLGGYLVIVRLLLERGVEVNYITLINSILFRVVFFNGYIEVLLKFWKIICVWISYIVFLSIMK